MTLEEKLELMKEYLLLRFAEGDWHGVADAAMDIREIVVAIKVTKELTK